MKYMCKMRIFYVILLIIVITIGISSCGKNSESKISYEEKEVNLPKNIEMIMDIKILDNNKIRIAGSSNETKKGSIWETTDNGENWNEIYSYTDYLEIDSNKKIECFANFLNGDELACVLYEYDKNNSDKWSSVKCYVLDDSGIQNEIKNNFPNSTEVEKSEDGNVFGYKVAAVSDNSLIVSNFAGELYLVDKTTSKIKEKLFDSGNAMLSCESFMVDAANNKVHSLNIKGNIVYSDTEGALNDKNDALECLASDYKKNTNKPVMGVYNDTYYLACDDGIRKYSKGNSELIVSKRNMSIVPSDVYLKKLYIENDKKMYLLVNSENNVPRILEYTANKTKTNSERKKLKVYSLKEDENVQRFIDYYEKKNNNIEISYTVGESDSNNYDEIIKKLNTKMMGKDGPDLIFFDGMEVSSYIEGDMLIKLDELCNDNYYNNVLKSYENKDGIYAIPLRFSLPIIIANNEELLKNSSDNNFAKSIIKDGAVGDEYAVNDYVLFMYQTMLSEAFKGNSINKKAIENYLMDVKSIVETYSNNTVTLKGLSIPPKDTSGIEQVILGNSNIAVDYIYNAKIVQYLNSLDGYYSEIAEKANNKYYVPQYIVGINALGSEKELAKEFLNYLLSYEGQQLTADNIGLPVNKIALNDCLNKLREDSILVQNENVSKKIQLGVLSKKEIEEFERELEQVSIQTNNDSIVMNVVMENTEKYVNGDITLDKAVNSIVNKIKIYFNE